MNDILEFMNFREFLCHICPSFPIRKTKRTEWLKAVNGYLSYGKNGEYFIHRYVPIKGRKITEVKIDGLLYSVRVVPGLWHNSHKIKMELV